MHLMINSMKIIIAVFFYLRMRLLYLLSERVPFTNVTKFSTATYKPLTRRPRSLPKIS